MLYEHRSASHGRAAEMIVVLKVTTSFLLSTVCLKNNKPSLPLDCLFRRKGLGLIAGTPSSLRFHFALASSKNPYTRCAVRERQGV